MSTKTLTMLATRVGRVDLLILILAAAIPAAEAGVGDIDPGYGVNGRFDPISYEVDYVYRPLADGRLLYPISAGYRRTNANGLPDPSFGTGGVQAWPAPYVAVGTGGWARAGDGTLYVALRGRATGGDQYAVIRLAPDGGPDPAFGTDGLARIDVPPDGALTASSFVIQPDGKLLLLLEHHNPENWYVIDGVLLIRLLADGGPDATFGEAGRVVIPTGPVDALDGVGLTLLADGRIGVHASPVTWLTQSGEILLDLPDGQEWIVACPIPGGGAIAWYRTDSGLRFAKVLADGSFETRFGPNGDGTVHLPPEASAIAGVDVSPDGYFVYVSWVTSPDGRWLVSRFHGDGAAPGSPDLDFGKLGTVDFRSWWPMGNVYGASDGSALVVTGSSAYRLLGTASPSPGFTGVQQRSEPWIETDAAVELTVFRAAGSNGPLRLRYRTIQSPVEPQATAGQDFDRVDGVLDWSDGDDGDKVIRIPLRTDQLQERIEYIYVEFGALSPGTWTAPEGVAVAVQDSPPQPTPPGGQDSASGGSSGGGSFGWPGLLPMLAAFVALRGQRRRATRNAIPQRS